MANKIARKSCLAAVAVLVILSLSPPSFASVGSINAVAGAVYFKAKGSDKWAVAAKGAPVDAGDSVKTGPDGRASLALSDGTRLSIGNSSELTITEFILKRRKRSAIYSLSAGKLRAIVGKFSGTSDVKVKTPTSTSGVKGTDFIVMNQGNANVLFGKEDSVAVSGDNEKKVLLTPGKMTENTLGGSPIEPVRVEPGSALEEARGDLEAITDVDAAVEWERAGRLPGILARWNINYGHYLADSQRFDEALDVFRIAIDLTELPSTRAEAHLERGTVYSRNLSEPKKALTEYMTVIESYPEPPFIENALFSAGMVNMELGEKAEALRLFKRYLSEYPQGGRRETVEFFIGILERQ